jgi:ankyrin repeat protein
MGGSVEIVNSLLAKDIPLNNDANSYSWTPAHYASADGHAAMIRFLIAKNIDITQRTLSGKSVYNVAEENNQSEVLKLITALQGDTSPQCLATISRSPQRQLEFPLFIS